MQTHVSEVAAIKEQIAAEHLAAKLGLQGLNTGTAHHVFITTRQANIGLLHKKSQKLVGDSAIALVAETLDAVPDIPSRDSILAVLRRGFNKPEEVELFCNALQEAWQAVDLFKERSGDGQAPMDLESVGTFAGLDLLKEHFGDEQARKLIFAPSSIRELPPS